MLAEGEVGPHGQCGQHQRRRGAALNSEVATGDGSFAFDLPPGTYKLSAVLTKRNSGDLATPETVTVTAGTTTTVELYANYP